MKHSQNQSLMKFVSSFLRMNGLIHINQCLVWVNMTSMLWLLPYSAEALKRHGLIVASEFLIWSKMLITDYFSSCSVFTRRISIFRDPFCIDTSNVLGFILNVPSDCRFGFVVLPFRRRHWIAVRKIHSFFWNLDSKLNAPERIGDDIEFLNYLNNLLKSSDVELLVVVRSEVGKSKKWLKGTSQWIRNNTQHYIWIFGYDSLLLISGKFIFLIALCLGADSKRSYI